MAKKHGDLLEALKERELMSAPPAALKPPAQTKKPPTTASQPNPGFVSKAGARLKTLFPKRVAFSLPKNLPTMWLALGILLAATFIFFLGRWSVGSAKTAAPMQKSEIPLHAPYTGAEDSGYTIQAISLSLDAGDQSKAFALLKYLQDKGLNVEKAYKANNRAMIFVGWATRAQEESLVNLLTWLRELTGPDGQSKPFQAAFIRGIPNTKG